MKNLILVAKIIGSKGLKGELKLHSYTQLPLNIKDYTLVTQNKAELAITNAYFYKDKVVASFKGITSKEQADVLIGTNLYVSRDSLPNLDEGQFYINDLVNLAVINLQQEIIGVVAAVHNFGAGDILEISKKENKDTNTSISFMLPFNKETIELVDINNQLIIVNSIYSSYV